MTGDFGGPGLAFTTIVFVYALSHTLIFGLPAYFIARRFDCIKWWVAVIVGFAIGAVPMEVMSCPWYYSEWSDLLPVGVMGGFGMAGGLAAWGVWRYLPRTAEG